MFNYKRIYSPKIANFLFEIFSEYEVKNVIFKINIFMRNRILVSKDNSFNEYPYIMPIRGNFGINRNINFKCIQTVIF